MSVQSFEDVFLSLEFVYLLRAAVHEDTTALYMRSRFYFPGDFLMSLLLALAFYLSYLGVSAHNDADTLSRTPNLSNSVLYSRAFTNDSSFSWRTVCTYPVYIKFYAHKTP